VHHIISNSGNGKNLICDVCINNKWHSVESQEIVGAVCTAAKSLNLQDKGIGPALIGAHPPEQEGPWHSKSWDTMIQLSGNLADGSQTHGKCTFKAKYQNYTKVSLRK